MKLETAWRRKAVAAELRDAFEEENLHNILVRETSEKVVWLNRILVSVWPHLDMWLSEMTTSFLIRTLVGVNQPDANGKPNSVQIDVKYVSFGKMPLVIEGVESKRPTAPYQVRLDLFFKYQGDLVVELEASLPFMKVPIKVLDLEMRGKLVVEMSFKDRGRIQQLALYFFETPTMNFAIRTVGMLDVMDLPMLKETIKGKVVGALNKAMRYNNALRFDWSGASSSSNSTKDDLSEEEQAKIRKAFLHQTVSALDEPEAAATAPSSSSTPSSISVSASETSPIQSNASNSNSTASLAAAVRRTTKRDPDAPSPQQPNSTSTSDPLSELSQDAKAHQTPMQSGSAKQGTPQTKASSGKITSSSSSSSSSSLPRPQVQQRQPTQAISTKKEEDLNEFLLLSPEEFRGTLRVRIFACTQLSSGDIFSVNPYVVLESNGVTHRTDVVKRTVNPIWTNADFRFPVPKFLPPKGLSLKIQVFDKNKIGSDDSLGHVLISLNGLLQKPDSPEPVDAPLVDALFANSQIHMECTFIPE